MKKEKLLALKRGIVNSLPWYVKAIITDDDFGQFSPSQLRALSAILRRAEDYRENSAPFYALSALEVLRKETGEIAYYDPSGSIQEESVEEVLSGAACGVYKNYMQKQTVQAAINRPQNRMVSGRKEEYMGDYKKDMFELMVNDFIADHPEYPDLLIGEPEKDESGNWVAYAEDDNATYILHDCGGNILLDYVATK